MNWNPYKRGYLAKSGHGYYFVYRQFDHEERSDRWFTEYEGGVGKYREQGHLTGKPHGFDSIEDAKAFCEKDARDLESML
jgi:hypothetical protein